MTRALWKTPFFVPFPLAQAAGTAEAAAPIRTKARAATILPSYIGRRFDVHNGHKYVSVFITEAMTGHKLGEFARTRKPFSYKKKDDGRRR
ncbi:hypothetical protein CXG81DRAFT_11031 [Caulochytrium protostelioides]|uniref:Ribosomal protein S19/S15 n=1 Tax=Caulochytrium protostelioides TaxID=1555241 RepID=A0A4P9XA70_9FUNG|nr:hypothetical protein CXG81DRAFT_11031 [Caulochytrium protostelioides]|eukprot:RKP02205.1 hypothetical protein CXG81DRAFT_11031 [Caulochytrium protostelioides]